MAPEVSRDLIAELGSLVGPAHVLVDPDATLGQRSDWSGRWVAPPAAIVVRPADTAEVRAVVLCCGLAGVPVVAQGGNSGLAGGATPTGAAVVMSTVRLDSIGPIGPDGQICVGAGATLASTQAAARAGALRVAVDLGSRDVATIGGMVATNASGLRAARLGPMRRWVTGLEVVLADGTLLDRMDGLSKDATGYDLLGLLCGSEGTLGVVTGVRLQLLGVPEQVCAAWVTFDNLGSAITAACSWFAAIPDVEAVELLDDRSLALVSGGAGRAGTGTGAPGQAAVLVEACGRSGVDTLLAAAIEGSAGVLHTEVAVDAPGLARLWARRDAVPLAIRAAGVPVKGDVAVPVDRIEELIAEVRSLAGHVVCFGHVVDGNIHVNVLGVGSAGRDEVEHGILRVAASLGGTISAEHGVGRAKVSMLGWRRTEAELAAFAAIKRAFDPDGLLNPGVIVP